MNGVVNPAVPPGRGTPAEIRLDLRALAGRPPRRGRTPPLAVAGLLLVLGLSLVLNGLPGQWALLAAIAFTALLSALLLATRSFHRSAWLTCGVMSTPGLIGIVQWLLASTADWAATETGILRALAAGLFCLSVGQVRDGRERERLLDGVTLLGGLVATLALWQTCTGQSFAWWPFPNRNHWAAFCELAGPVAAWRALQTRRWQAGPALLLAMTGMLSGSRTGLVLIAAQLVWLAWWTSRQAVPKLSLRAVSAGAVALPLLAILLGGESLWTRWRDTQPLLYRDQIWISAWELITQRPWQGHGIGSFTAVYPSVMRFDTGDVVHRAHNDWLEWMVEGGIPAVLPICILLVATLVRLRAHPWALGVPVVLAHSLVDYPLDRFSLLLLFGAIATLAVMNPLVARSPQRTRKKPQ